MDVITLLASSMDSDRNTYSKLLAIVVSLMSELVITNKKLLQVLK